MFQDARRDELIFQADLEVEYLLPAHIELNYHPRHLSTPSAPAAFLSALGAPLPALAWHSMGEAFRVRVGVAGHAQSARRSGEPTSDVGNHHHLCRFLRP